MFPASYFVLVDKVILKIIGTKKISNATQDCEARGKQFCNHPTSRLSSDDSSQPEEGPVHVTMEYYRQLTWFVFCCCNKHQTSGRQAAIGTMVNATYWLN